MAETNIPPSGLGNIQKIPFPPPLIPNITFFLKALCSELEFARDPIYCASKQGGNNNITIFTCIPLGPKHNQQRIRCILRTAKYINFSLRRQSPVNESVKMLVALSHVFGKAGVGLPIPGVLAYDSTFENAIVCPYIIQEEVEGTTLLMQYRTMNRSLLDQRGPNHNPHLLKRRELARQVAGFIAQKEGHTFSGYGVLRNASDMNSLDPKVRAARYVLGVAPARIAGKLIPTSLDLSKFINALACARLLKASSALDVRAIKNARKLLDIWKCMSERGLLTDQPSILWHPDFHPRNILFNNTVLTGVIDWDNSMALPRIMTRESPSFLWKNDPVLLSQPESDAIKDAFDDTIGRLIPGYKEDAYSIYRVLIRALGMYTLFGVDYKHYHELSWENLVRECDVLFPEQAWGLDRPFFL